MRLFFAKLSKVKWRDLKHIFMFLIACIPACFLRQKRKNLWLVCEYAQEARDNGYWFYRYVKEQHPEQDVVYAIDPLAEDYDRVCSLGETIVYGSFKHWIYYLAAQYNISSQKSGKPNAAICYFLEVYGIVRHKSVFLQHGITKENLEMFHYRRTKMEMFICGAEPEYQFICENFGYPKGHVQYAGFARFDNLYKASCKKPTKRQILICPTWRRWLYELSSNPYENTMEGLEESEYFNRWKDVLCSTELGELLRNYHYEVVFFPHRNATAFPWKSLPVAEHVQVVDWHDCDLQQLMMDSACLITDFSSVAMDFAYMKRPLLYYQFDQEMYETNHSPKGYFAYDEMGFGSVVTQISDFFSELQKMLSQDCALASVYENRINQFYRYHDDQNCERIYKAIKALGGSDAE